MPHTRPLGVVEGREYQRLAELAFIQQVLRILIVAVQTHLPGRVLWWVMPRS